MFVAFAMLVQSVAAFPSLAQADVTVAVSDASGAVTNYTLATSTDNVAISYTLPSGAGSTTPTLDALSSLLGGINTALATAKASTTCSGSGTATAQASASATVVLDASTTVTATAKASASVNCTPVVEPPLPPVYTPVTIVAQKIICDDVSMLPKWANGGPDIASTTAKEYVATHLGCHFAPNWKFQWGFGSSAATSTGVRSLSGSFVGEADGSEGQGTNTGTAYDDWKTFSPTDTNGVTATSLENLSGATSLWVREVLESGYVPFTFDAAHPSNENTNSAEMYCANDVLNYDNYDQITNPVAGKTYYCVAFNAKKKEVGNQCVVPEASTSGTASSSKVAIVNNSEKTLQTILAESGYTLDAINDQTNIDHWSFGQNNPATIEVKLLGKYAGNSEVFGYYTGTATTTFNPVFRYGVNTGFPSTPSLTTIGSTTTFTVAPGTSLSFGFAIDTQAGNLTRNLFATDPSLNVDLMRHALVYHPSSDEYVIAFEDLAEGVTDSDYNDLVVAIRVVGCDTPPPPPPANTPPVITVIPPNPMTITLGTIFTDPGATAFDMEDGTITPKIVTTGSVNTNATGTYTIYYNVKDSQGLAAVEKTRTVTVVAPQFCAAPLDVILVIDRSGSMSDDNNPQLPLTKAKAAATAFVGTLSTTTDRAGVVSYNDTARLDRALTSNFTAVNSSIASLVAGGATNIGDAFNKASAEMTTHGRPSAKHVIVLLSDGLPNIPTNVASATAYALSQATIAKAKGYVVYTIGLGTDVNPALMKQLATTPDDYYYAPTAAELDTIYRTIAAEECGRIPGVISGKKWNDREGNGIVDGNDVGIPDWQITLTSVGDNNATSRIEKTNTNGEFTFSDIFPGTYLLCEVPKSGWVETAPATTTNNGCYSIDVSAGAQITGKDFLNTQTVKPQCSDGKDNDGDGKIDYPADTGCDGPNDNNENNPPVITVLGSDPMTITIGTTFTDPGATALDPEDGDITAKIVTTGAVNTAAVGTYTITYNVKDSQGLAAQTKTRTVKVSSQCSDGIDNDHDGKIDMADTGCDNPNDNNENNAPVITVLGLNPLNITLGTIFTDPGATAFDMEDGTITPKIVTTGSVNTNATGTYTIYYNVKDSQGLAAVEKTRTVNVNPVVTQCSDGRDNDGDGKIDYPADTGCDSPNDNDENNAPVITVLGDDPMTVHIGSLFTDPGATAFDMEDGTITPKIVATGTVDTLNVGTYTISYNVKDSQGLAAVEKTRTVKVVSSCSDGKDNDGDGKIDYPADTGCENPNDDSENQAPTLTLLGDAIMNIFVGTTFTDPGATATDTEDGDLTPKIITAGTVNASTLGTYFLTYNVTDSGGLSAPTTTRTVNVVSAGCTTNCGGGGSGSDNNRPIITLIGANPLLVTQGTTFIDPGATAVDPEDGDVTSKIVVGGTVDTSKLGDYELTYNVSDSKGLPAAQVKRTVTVVPQGGGGGSVSLSIFNEKLATTSTTTVVISWSTNQPADSRIVYGLDPHATLGVAPLYGYQLTTATDTALVTAHSMTITGIPSAIATYFRPVSSDGVRTATGIELTRTPDVTVPAECFYLKEYMRLGANNNPSEVTKLQTFLNRYEGFTDLQVTGTFDITTDRAVRSFQDKYAADVLTPWNLPGNTGYVYYTTEKKINEIYCQREFPLSQTQLEEIASFRELINKINTQGAGAVPTLPLVGVNTGAGATGTTGGGAGAVAGVSTETGGAIASGVSTANATTSPVRDRGQIALADLLAATPSVAGSMIGGGATDTKESVMPVEGENPATSTVMGTSTKRGLALAIESISSRTKLSVGGVYVLLVLILASIVLSIMIGRRYYVARKTVGAKK